MLRERRRGKCNAIDQRVDRQPEAEPCPTEIEFAVMVVAVHMMVILFMIAKFFLFVIVFRVDRQIMLMKVEQPNHKEHEQQADQRNGQRRFSRTELRDRQRQQMHQRHTEHHTRNEAQHELNLAMR